jgi:hypothetical protein
VTALVPTGGHDEVRGPAGASVTADAVVLAVGAAVAARLLRPLDARVAELLGQQETASVATAILTYRRGEVREGALGDGTGLLVPAGTGRTLKAATVLSRRWPHLDDDRSVRLRVSVGRAGEERLAWLGDHELLHELRRDLAELTGLTATPTEVTLQRWPETMPQLVVGHRDAVAEARQRLRGGTPRPPRRRGLRRGRDHQLRPRRRCDRPSGAGHAPGRSADVTGRHAPVRSLRHDPATRPFLVIWEVTRACELVCPTAGPTPSTIVIPSSSTPTRADGSSTTWPTSGRPVPSSCSPAATPSSATTCRNSWRTAPPQACTSPWRPRSPRG